MEGITEVVSVLARSTWWLTRSLVKAVWRLLRILITLGAAMGALASCLAST